VSLAADDDARFPTTIAGQFRRHAPQYAFGTAMLAVYQLAMMFIVLRAKAAIDDIFSDDPSTA